MRVGASAATILLAFTFAPGAAYAALLYLACSGREETTVATTSAADRSSRAVTFFAHIEEDDPSDIFITLSGDVVGSVTSKSAGAIKSINRSTSNEWNLATTDHLGGNTLMTEVKINRVTGLITVDSLFEKTDRRGTTTGVSRTQVVGVCNKAAQQRQF